MRPLLMQPWSECDVELLASLLKEREPVRRIAWKLRRSESAVRTKLGKLGLRIHPGTRTIPQMRRAIFGKGSLEGNA